MMDLDAGTLLAFFQIALDPTFALRAISNISKVFCSDLAAQNLVLNIAHLIECSYSRLIYPV